jgi:hypothetical protein
MNKAQVSYSTERTIGRQNLAPADLESTGTITGADAGEIGPPNEAVQKNRATDKNETSIIDLSLLIPLVRELILIWVPCHGSRFCLS